MSSTTGWSTWSLSTKVSVSIGLVVAAVFVVGINLFR